MQIRINKFLADKSIASRRAIDAMIMHGRIFVNGKKLTKPGIRVGEKDVITIDGKKVERKTKHAVVILLNKPTACITTCKDAHGRKTVFDYVKIEERVFPIGRLDKDTTGVLLLTNDGELANNLMHPRCEVEKVYRAYIDKPLNDRDRKQLESGITLDGRKTFPCTTHFFRNSRRDVIITLHEGRNRQIHRMFNALDYRVHALERISYAGLSAVRLARGRWRYLTQKKIDNLVALWNKNNILSSTNGKTGRTLK